MSEDTQYLMSRIKWLIDEQIAIASYDKIENARFRIFEGKLYAKVKHEQLHMIYYRLEGEVMEGIGGNDVGCPLDVPEEIRKWLSTDDSEDVPF